MLETPSLSACIQNWIGKSATKHERYQWVMDRMTRAISWKRRADYGWWEECGRLRTIFRQMHTDLNNTSCVQDNEVADLLKLRARVVKRYDKYEQCHCWLYKWLFASRISQNYQELIQKIDDCLIEALPSLKTESLSEKCRQKLFDCLLQNAEDVAFQDKFRRVIPVSGAFLSSLSPDQYQRIAQVVAIASHISMEKLAPNLLRPLVESQIAPRLKQLTGEEKDDEVAQLDPHVLNLLPDDEWKTLNIGALSSKQLDEIGLTRFAALEPTQVQQIDLKKLSKKRLNQILTVYPQLLQHFNIPTLKANLAKVSFDHYGFFSDPQLKELVLVFNEDQLIQVGIEKVYALKLLNQINLGLFTEASQLAKFMAQRWDLIPYFEPLSVLLNLPLIPRKHYNLLGKDQILKFDARFLDETKIREIGLSRFSVPQLIEVNRNLLNDLNDICF